MSGEIHEAPIVHGTVSCSSLHLSSLELLSTSTCAGVDTSLAITDNLVENKIVRSQLQTLVPREFNIRAVGDFLGPNPDSSLYTVHETNTFDGIGVSLGGIDTSLGLGIQVPASGLYSGNFVFEFSSNTTENVVQLGSNAYLEMTNPSNFQQNSSFSVDFEWKGTTFDTNASSDGMTGSRVALVSTGGSGNYFGVFATKYDSQKYSLVAECSDGSATLSLDLGQWQKDTWFHIIASWSSAQNTLSVQIDKSRFQTTGSIGNISSRPFYFGYDGTTMGGSFVYKYVRFHQDVLNAHSFENLPVVTSVDADGFRCEIVYSGGGVVVPSIAKVGTAVSTIPSTGGEVIISMTTGPSAGPRRVVQSITLVPGSMKGNEVLNQTFASAPGDIVRFESSQTIVTKEISVVGLKFDNMKVPVISMVSEVETVERGAVFTDSGISAVEIDANGVETDVSSSVTKTADPLTNTVGEKYIYYTLTASDGLLTVRRCKTVNVVDISIPVIVLTGASEINHERGTVFIDQGATSFDGSIELTSLNQVHNPVLIDVAGTYTITYNVIDARGNHAHQVTRKVNIIDTMSPIITVTAGSNGLIGQTVERLDTYTDPGATAVDQNGNEDISNRITVANQVDTSTVGTYSVIYQCTDDSGQYAIQKQRIVTVVDTVKPQISITGPENLTIERSGTYAEQGATAFDFSSAGVQDTETELTSSIATTTKAKSLNGTNTWYVKVIDSGGNKYAFTADSTFSSQGYLLYPEITLTAGETYVFNQSDASNNNHPIRFADSNGSSYSTGVTTSGTPGQAGATVTFTVPSYGYTTMKYVCQHHGAGMGNTIYVKAASDAVNTATAQKFQMCYDVSDAASNAATTKYRMVTVSDSSSPSISLTGGTVTIERAIGSYSEPGYSASDGTVDLTSRVVVTNNVNTTTHGDYYYHYDVSDSSGNTATRVSRLVQVRDTRAPVVTVTGGTQYVERYSTYNDPGATANDDGTSVSVNTSNPVNTSNVGQYTITYTATDSSGNQGSATRTVHVQDNTSPVVTINRTDLNPYYIEVATGTYTEHSASAVDGNGGPALTVSTSGSVNTNVVGTYNIYYTATDSTAMSGQAHRQVIVRDTVAPVITLVGNVSVQIEVGSVTSYVDAGATVSDASGNAVLSSSNNVNVNSPGSYAVTYTATDGYNNATPVLRTVIVIHASPEINLVGAASMTVEAGATWTDPGATSNYTLSVSDPVNTSNQTVSTSTMMSTPGTYTIQYNTSNPPGTATTASRTVIVQDTVAPVFNSFNDVTHERGQSYSDVKPTAYDPRDSGNVSIIPTQHYYNVNSNVVGDYQVDYVATDSAGLSTTSRRKNVYVRDTVAPVITLTGDGTSSGSPYTWTQGDMTSWSDPGYNAIDQVDNTNLDSSVTVDSSGIDFNTPGDYQVVYNLNNSSYGPAAVQKIRYVKIETPPPSEPMMDWVWPMEDDMVSDLKDYHPNLGGGQEVVAGYDNLGNYKVEVAGDSVNGKPFHTAAPNDGKTYGVNGSDYVDFIFTFADENTWCSGYRQFGHVNWGSGTYTKDIEIYTGDANFGPWTLVASDSHGTWHNNDINTFTSTDTTTEWTPSGPSKYLLVRTKTNHGDTHYGGRITVRFLQIKIGLGGGGGGIVLPVTSGLRAHYNWTSWKSTTVWEDLSGNGHHMQNVNAGASEVVSAADANMTDNNTGGQFAYVRGDQSSRWNLGGYTGNQQLPQNSWTYIHIHRYDPVYDDKDGRVLGAVGSNTLFGTWNGYVGYSHHGGGFSGENYIGSRHNSHWVFQIERPGKYSRTSTKDTTWTDLTGGQSDISWRPTISAGQFNEHAAWNIAELILFDRTLSDSEVNQFKTWMMEYKAGNITASESDPGDSGGTTGGTTGGAPVVQSDVASDGRVKDETETFNNPKTYSNVLIEIHHIDIHLWEEASITWHYNDDTTETITARGNGNTQFKNSSGSWSTWMGEYGDHTSTIVDHTGLNKGYRFEKVNRGGNSWEFETLDGGVTKIVMSHLGIRWGGLSDVDLTWT